MKEIYLTTMGLLNPQVMPEDPAQLAIYNQLKKLNFIDEDKGQLSSYQTKPPVAFPCALITVRITQTENLGNNVQRCIGQVNIKLAFDYTGETAATTPQQVRDNSLSYYDLINAVYVAIQGKQGGNGKFNRLSALPEQRPDKIKAVNMVFSCSWIDSQAVG